MMGVKSLMLHPDEQNSGNKSFRIQISLTVTPSQKILHPTDAKQTEALRCIFLLQITDIIIFLRCDLYILVIHRAVQKIAASFFKNLFFFRMEM